jgi:hypothetical protein
VGPHFYASQHSCDARNGHPPSLSELLVTALLPELSNILLDALSGAHNHAQPKE